MSIFLGSRTLGCLAGIDEIHDSYSSQEATTHRTCFSLPCRTEGEATVAYTHDTHNTVHPHSHTPRITRR